MDKTKAINSFKDFCPRCVHYEIETGVCKKIFENVRSYPKKFIKKCNGAYFESDTGRIVLETKVENNEVDRRQPVVAIPRFNRVEMIEIEKMLRDHRIEYRKHPVQLLARPEGGYHEYIVFVPEHQFTDAITLLKEHYGVGIKISNTFTGNCPACGAEVVNNVKCPGCRLTLAGDYTEALQYHPFVVFLKRAELL